MAGIYSQILSSITRCYNTQFAIGTLQVLLQTLFSIDDALEPSRDSFVSYRFYLIYLLYTILLNIREENSYRFANRDTVRVPRTHSHLSPPVSSSSILLDSVGLVQRRLTLLYLYPRWPFSVASESSQVDFPAVVSTNPLEYSDEPANVSGGET